jgi:CheY-like chemotaxis protein
MFLREFSKRVSLPLVDSVNYSSVITVQHAKSLYQFYLSARSLAAGCDGHLTKPLNQTELIQTIVLLTRNGVDDKTRA